MKKQLIVIASKNELPLVTECFKGIPVLITGVGAINVIRSLSPIDRHTELINIGYAGSPDFQIGQRIEIGISKLHHKVQYEGDETFYLDGGGYVTCYTATDFVTETDKSRCVFDMELAFICALGFKSVRAFKTVSDHLNYKEYEQATE